MLSWSEFEQRAPEIAEVGRRLLYHPAHGEVAILATVDEAGSPRVAPVCPIFSGGGVYVLAGRRTPKVRQLAGNGRFALHALVGADDQEFQMRGIARAVRSATERDAVILAIPFPSYDPTDPLFELRIGCALAVSWPAPGSRRKLTWSAS